MNKRFNHGIYALLIQQYIAYKRSLGLKMEDIEERLSRFDQLTIARKETVIGISKELFDIWSAPLPAESDTNRYSRICILRQFSRYLQLLGHNSYIPRLPKYNFVFIPYIFTQEEMAAIFEASDKLFLKRRYMYAQACVMPTLLRMLYSTGLRIGEALNLKHKDVHLDKGYLLISTSKNGQERIVPMSLSLAEVCKDYCLYKKKQEINTEPDTYFFTAANGSPCKTVTIYEIFRTVLYKAGISHQGRGKGPRMHDLRHTFCVNALLKISEAGLDLYYSMPVLSTYIGHQSIEATNKYVRLTSELYPQLLTKVNAAYQYLFPEIGIGSADIQPPHQTEKL
ncbi:MAG: tyrosine-type recombinase/integrase [Niabella sp.]